MLPDDERASVSRFMFARDRQAALLTRHLVRSVLSEVCGALAPEQWTFTRSVHGRPTIANPGFDWLDFNISHTRDLVVCALAMRAQVGVDVESLRRRVPVELAGRYFSPTEAHDVTRAPGRLRHTRFLQYWTLKESYIKARGLGLAIPLDSFSFHIGDRRAGPSLLQAADDDVKRWRFSLEVFGAGHLLAVAYASNENAPLRILHCPAEPLLFRAGT